MPIKFNLDKYPNKYFIETGTYLGEGIQIALDSRCFDYIYSIEIDTLRHITCRERFSIYDNVTLIKGDSGELLKLVLKHINVPCTFWLDAHFCGDDGEFGPKWCPLVEELEAIKNHHIKNHTIIIDDYRCMDNTHFDKERGIPVGFPGKKKLLEILQSINFDYSIKFLDGVVPNDIVVARIDYEDIAESCLNKIINKIEYEDILENLSENIKNQVINSSKYELKHEGEIISKSIINDILDNVDIIVNENYEDSLRRKEYELQKWEQRLEERELEGEIVVQEVLIDIEELKNIEKRINKMDEALLARENKLDKISEGLLKRSRELNEKEKELFEKEEQMAIKEITFKEMIIDLHLQTQVKRYEHLERKATSRDIRKQKRKRNTKKK